MAPEANCPAVAGKYRGQRRGQAEGPKSLRVPSLSGLGGVSQAAPTVRPLQGPQRPRRTALPARPTPRRIARGQAGRGMPALRASSARCKPAPSRKDRMCCPNLMASLGTAEGMELLGDRNSGNTACRAPPPGFSAALATTAPARHALAEHPCTWRTLLIKVAAEVVVKTRQFVVRLSASGLHQNEA
jgi:hypothetical protein